MPVVAAPVARAAPVVARACGPAAGVPLDGDAALAGWSRITGAAVLGAAMLLAGMMGAAMLWTALAIVMRGALLLAAAPIFPLLDGDTFPLPLLFGWLFGPGIAVDRQVYFSQDLGTLQLLRLDIFDNGRRSIFFRLRLLSGLAGGGRWTFGFVLGDRRRGGSVST